MKGVDGTLKGIGCGLDEVGGGIKGLGGILQILKRPAVVVMIGDDLRRSKLQNWLLTGNSHRRLYCTLEVGSVLGWICTLVPRS